VMPTFLYSPELPDDIEIEFEVYCSCGAGLCNQTTVDDEHRRGRRITVEPCEACLERAVSEAREQAELDVAQREEASERAAALQDSDA